jgi:hypothetical protein
MLFIFTYQIAVGWEDGYNDTLNAQTFCEDIIYETSPSEERCGLHIHFRWGNIYKIFTMKTVDMEEDSVSWSLDKS